MGKSLEEMGSDGKDKLSRKSASMTANYNSAKSAMKRKFGEQPFGPQTTDNYNKGVDAAVYVPPDAGEWKTNWMKAMAR